MIDRSKPQASTFRLVLEVLEKEKNWRYICYVLQELRNCGRISGVQLVACKNYINDTLSGYYGYGSWLRGEHPKLYKRLSPTRLQTASREGRIAWVKHIIQVLES